MLEAVDYTGKTKSKYICDRCGKHINTYSEKRYKICIDTPKDSSSVLKPIKRYDLCKKCAKLIVYIIEKGK